MNKYQQHWDSVEVPSFSEGPWKTQSNRKWYYISASAAAIVIVMLSVLPMYRSYQKDLHDVEIAKAELLKISLLLNSSIEELEPVSTLYTTQKQLEP